MKVYNGARQEDIEPTRLHFDAETLTQWREKGFFSVLSNQPKTGSEPSTALLHRFITLGKNHPVAEGKPLGSDYDLDINREFSCPAPSEFEEYREDNPKGGMPYAVTGLTDGEYKVLATWLEQGAVVEKRAATTGDRELEQLSQWEAFLNQPDLCSQLVSRYLYEHLFLAHLYVSEKSASNQQFFQMVRSSTPAPEAIQVINTTRPNDEPGAKVYYRLRPITDTLVHKTHIMYRFDQKRMQRYKNLFFASNWAIKQLPGYGYTEASNPFVAFAAMPAKARYQFMLDDAEYFTRIFIRGPVCRGQIATDVIRDQFWVMYENPETEQYVNSPGFRSSVSELLGLPGQKSDILDLGPEYLKYQEKRNQYRQLRKKQYHNAFVNGLSLDWKYTAHPVVNGLSFVGTNLL